MIAIKGATKEENIHVNKDFKAYRKRFVKTMRSVDNRSGIELYGSELEKVMFDAKIKKRTRR